MPEMLDCSLFHLPLTCIQAFSHLIACVAKFFQDHKFSQLKPREVTNVVEMVISNREKYLERKIKQSKCKQIPYVNIQA